MFRKRLFLISLLLICIVLSPFADGITQTFAIDAIIPTTGIDYIYTISVIDTRDGGSSFITNGLEFDLGRGENLLYEYTDMFSIDYTANRTDPVTMRVKFSPAESEDGASIAYNVKSTPFYAVSSSDLINDQLYMESDGKTHFNKYVIYVPSKEEFTISLTPEEKEYDFYVNNQYYQSKRNGNKIEYDFYEYSSGEDISNGEMLSYILDFSFRLDEASYKSAISDASGIGHVYYINVTIGVEGK